MTKKMIIKMFNKVIKKISIRMSFFILFFVLKQLKPEYIYKCKDKGGISMIIEEKRNSGLSSNSSMSGTIQNLILENREKLNVSGVNDVLSFDDQVVIMETELGMLTIKGENLKINKLSLDTSEVIVEGKINNLSYSEHQIKNEGGLFGKIFK